MAAERPTARQAALVGAARRLAAAVASLSFGPPVAYVYNPLDYAREAHEQYLRRCAAACRGDGPVLFLGMNPGPWGMAQTGVPFGDVASVREWLGIEASVGHPAVEHPRKPVLGYGVTRGEVSGRRLWGLMRERFGTAERFLRGHFVANYCPLMFLATNGANLTPDRLPAAEREALLAACDEHLLSVLRILRPCWAIGVGSFAEKRLRAVQAASASDAQLRGLRIGSILHPSPASPQANRDWKGEATRRLQALGVWPRP